MCGVAAFINKEENFQNLIEWGEDALESLSHRGPDDNGKLIINHGEGIFCHTRLSILDLSINGSQPMTSRCGNFSIIYNGEIYNKDDLKKKINSNSALKGHSDTEILLETISEIGLDETLKSLRGMYAFLVLDKKNNLLYAVRDSFGEKPLFYCENKSSLAFASETNILMNNNSSISKENLNFYSLYGFFPKGKSILEDVFEVLPGHYLKYDLSNFSKEEHKYFDANYRKSQIQTFDPNLNKLDDILNNVVRNQLEADVEVGTFLSGGIDSSLITAIASKNHKKKITCFTLGFEEESFSEVDQAKRFADFLNCNHKTLFLKKDDLLDTIVNIQDIYDEPLGDPAQIPTVLLSKFASKSIKVALTGDGGDELFGGYNRYLFSEKLSKYSSFFKKIDRSMNLFLKQHQKDKVFDLIGDFLGFSEFSEKLRKVRKIDLKSNDSLYSSLLSLGEIHVLKDALKEKSLINCNFGHETLEENMMLADIEGYMPQMLLKKIDRASMSFGLEVRSPYLDRNVYEESIKIPFKQKINKNLGKIPLRKLHEKYYPSKLNSKRKKGFAVPLAQWFREELLSWVMEVLDSNKLKDQKILNNSQINFLLKTHLSGQRNNYRQLWALITLQLWIDKNWSKIK